MWSQKGREGITNQSVVREKLLDFFNETNMSKYKFAKRSVDLCQDFGHKKLNYSLPT